MIFQKTKHPLIFEHRDCGCQFYHGYGVQRLFACNVHKLREASGERMRMLQLAARERGQCRRTRG